MTTQDYLDQLQQDKEDLVDNLEAMGITDLTGNETFTQLVPKVLDIEGTLNWENLGLTTPTAYQDCINTYTALYEGCKDIQNNWIPNEDLSNKFYNNLDLIYMPYVDTSLATNMSRMFLLCNNLEQIALLDTSNATNLTYFVAYTKLKTIPTFDTSSATTLNSFADGCTSLTTFPLLDTSSVLSMDNMIYNCNSIDITGLDNILQMCINATNYTSTKKFKSVASATNYSSSLISSLPHYQAFLAAGWTYN